MCIRDSSEQARPEHRIGHPEALEQVRGWHPDDTVRGRLRHRLALAPSVRGHVHDLARRAEAGVVDQQRQAVGRRLPHARGAAAPPPLGRKRSTLAEVVSTNFGMKVCEAVRLVVMARVQVTAAPKTPQLPPHLLASWLMGAVAVTVAVSQ